MTNAYKQTGFTLIEVMISLAILAALTLLTAQTLKSTFDNRAKVQADLSREAKVYDALRIMQADVGAAFHYRDYETQMFNEVASGTQAQPPVAPAASTDPIAPPAAPPPPDKAFGTPKPTPAQLTAFVGDAKSMYFTVSNHVRTLRDAHESDQAKVGYFLKSCKSPDGKHEQSECLFRGLSTMLDDDVTKLEHETVLLENVHEFKLRYLGPGHDDYVESWKTDKTGSDPLAKDVFPFAVEITLVTDNKHDRKEKQFGATVLAPIRFPNNAKPKAGSGSTSQPAPAKKTDGP